MKFFLFFYLALVVSVMDAENVSSPIRQQELVFKQHCDYNECSFYLNRFDLTNDTSNGFLDFLKPWRLTKFISYPTKLVESDYNKEMEIRIKIPRMFGFTEASLRQIPLCEMTDSKSKYAHILKNAQQHVYGALNKYFQSIADDFTLKTVLGIVNKMPRIAVPKRYNNYCRRNEHQFFNTFIDQNNRLVFFGADNLAFIFEYSENKQILWTVIREPDSLHLDVYRNLVLIGSKGLDGLSNQAPYAQIEIQEKTNYDENFLFETSAEFSFYDDLQPQMADIVQELLIASHRDLLKRPQAVQRWR